MGKEPARLQDICKKLGLSKATVSKALNGYSSVSEVTRQQVLACARQLGYSTPQRDQDPNARLIRIGLNSVLFAGNTAESSPHQAILSGLLEELGQSHYDTVIIPPHVVTNQSIPYDEAMRSLNLDCAFINGLKTSDPYYQQLQTTTFPTVCWDMRVDNPNVHCIGCDSM